MVKTDDASFKNPPSMSETLWRYDIAIDPVTLREVVNEMRFNARVVAIPLLNSVIDSTHHAQEIPSIRAEAKEAAKIVRAAENDPVNHPKHYTFYKGVEIIDLTEQMNFNRGNAVKYISRAGIKDQKNEIEDLQKAKWYISREIERLENEKGIHPSE